MPCYPLDVLPKVGDERLTTRFETKKSRRPRPSMDTLFTSADPFPSSVLQRLANGVRHCRDISLADCTNDNGRLSYQGCIYLHELVSSPALSRPHDHGPPRPRQDLRPPALRIFWPRMRQEVERYLRNCHTCKRSKSTRHAPHSVLKPCLSRLPVARHLHGLYYWTPTV